MVALAIAFVLKTFVAQPFSIPSGSMEPQLAVGDRVVVARSAYRFHDPNRGDLVVFSSPDAADEDTAALPFRVVRGIFEGVGLARSGQDVLIKRVIGLPGETVEGRAGRIYVGDRLLVEPYLAPTVVTADFGPVALGPDEVWLMGDNRPASRDSRSFGAVDTGSIIGRALFKAWPPGSIAFL